MKKLNDIQIEEVLDKYSQDNNTDVTLSQATRTKEVFNKAMNEEVNVNKTIEEQQNLITSILLKIKAGWSIEDIFNYHSDNKHLSYFKLIMGDEYASLLYKALEKYSVPTAIFKGLQLNTPADLVVVLQDRRIAVVHQLFVKTENESLELKEFWVKIDGKEIYNFEKAVNGDFEDEAPEDDSKYDTYTNLKNLTQMENDLSRKMNILYNKKKAGKQKTYNVKKGKAKVIDNLNTVNNAYPNGVRIEVILSHTGKQIYKARDVATGQFIKYRR